MTSYLYDISIIIPTHNRCEVLKKCLDALSRQTHPPELFEIIVSDDGSEDNTEDVVEKFMEINGMNVRYLRQQPCGASAARNQAILKSKGRILLIINDDTISTPNMLEEHMKSHDAFPDENYAVLGRVTISGEVPYSIFSKIHLDASFNKFEGKTELDWRAFITCNISVKKLFLLEYGLFEEKFRLLHEDIELAERLSHHDLKIIYNPEALGYHHHYIEEKDFLKSARQDGESLAIWYRKSPHLKKELASIGLYLTLPIYKRTRYILAALLVNRITSPFLLILARYFSNKNERIALSLYIKVFQALKRDAIRNELHKSNRADDSAA